jgi:alkanesulfonate monooxygenase SsuD/methylene tetrahydromethanopterin reductase-like flavin-dependent oxidoreductase (luciferase family)
LKFILQAGNWIQHWKVMEEAVPLADKAGFWGFLIPDHYMWGDDRGGDATLESWIALTYLAAKTEQIKLGTLVTPIPFRLPGMLAKELSTLDIISNGRVIFGVGAGWSETEFRGYSEWNEPKVRVDKTKEGLELILKLWESKENERVDFHGKYYKAEHARLDPKPVQKPHPTLLFGGVGTRMLKLAGKYADICCIPPWTNDRIAAKKIVLESARQHSRENAISFGSILFRMQKYDRDQVRKELEVASKERIDYFVIGFPLDSYVESMSDFAKNVMPTFAQ